MNTIKLISRSIFYTSATAFALLLSGCDDDEPAREETPELITQVVLTFTSASQPLTFTASDPDGDGPQDLEIEDPIVLAPNQGYTLNIQFFNGLVAPGDPGHDLSEEILEEADEHMLFFGWTDGVFSDPSGDGNLDSTNDDVNYEDADSNELPLGLTTTWLTGTGGTGTLRIILKHQPGLKSSSSGSTTGETDVDVTFPVTVAN